MEYEMMSIEDLWEALEEAKNEDYNDLECGRILAMLCRRIGQSGDFQQSINVGYGGLVYFRKVGDGLGEAQLLYDIAVGHSKVNEHILTIPLLEKCVELYRTHGTAYQMGRALSFLGSSLHEIGKCEEAVDLYDQAMAFYSTEEDWLDSAGFVALEKGHCLRAQWKYLPAILAYDHAREIAVKCDVPNLSFSALTAIGRTWIDLSEYSLAADAYAKANDIAEFLDDPRMCFEVKTSLGEALIGLGRYKKAKKVLEAAIEIQTKQRWLLKASAETHLQYAHALAGLGKRKSAKKIYRRMRTLFEETGRLAKAYLYSFKLATLMPSEKRLEAIALLEKVAKESAKVDGFFVPRASRVCLAELLQQSNAPEDKQHALEVLAEVPEEMYENFGEYTDRYIKVKQRLLQELGGVNG